jgi:signal transduction histidine kinase
MMIFFRDPANLRHSLNTVIPLIVFLTSIFSGVVACNVAGSTTTSYLLIGAVSAFSSLCILVVILAMTQPLKEVVQRAEKLLRFEEVRKEKSQMMEVYQLIEKLMSLVHSKGLKAGDEKEVIKEIESLDYVIPLGYMSLMVAHEVRNPLNTITGMSELLKAKATDEVDRVYLDTILDASKKIEVFTNELLDFTDDEVAKEDFDLNRVLDETVGALTSEFGRVKCEFTKGEPAVYNGDRNRIHQAVYNISRNAFEFENACIAGGAAQEGIVTIAAQTSGPVSISVSNVHSRIEQEDKEAVFKPFFTRKKKGRGIGLFIAMRNIKLHQGDIKVESGDGGTTFTIILPVHTHESGRHSGESRNP